LDLPLHEIAIRLGAAAGAGIGTGCGLGWLERVIWNEDK
jgi:hypothetical protein